MLKAIHRQVNLARILVEGIISVVIHPSIRVNLIKNKDEVVNTKVASGACKLTSGKTKLSSFGQSFQISVVLVHAFFISY